MICRKWGSGDSTVACVRLCRSTTVVLPVRGCREETVAGVVSVGSGCSSRFVSRAGVS